MSKIFGKPYAQKFLEGLSSDAKASFAAALDDNGDFLRVDLDLGPTALQETYEEDTCVKCALSFGGKELQGVICYTSETVYDFVSYEPQDEMRFWEIDAETCEITEILTHEKVTLGDLRLALGGGAGGGFDPSDIQGGNILQNAVLGLNEDSEIVKGSLFGKYVKIINASDIPDPLTEDFINENFRNGLFVQGLYKGYRNLIFLPCEERVGGNYLFGVALRGYQGSGQSFGGIMAYEIIGGSLAFRNSKIDFENDDTIAIKNKVSLIGKSYPSYPETQTNKSFHFVLDNGTLKWYEGNGLYLHTVVFTVSGSSGNLTLTILSDSETAIAFDAGTGNIVAENSTFIQFANCGNFVFTRYGANGFNPAIYEFDTATGTFSTTITLATVESDTVTPIG